MTQTLQAAVETPVGTETLEDVVFSVIISLDQGLADFANRHTEEGYVQFTDEDKNPVHYERIIKTEEPIDHSGYADFYIDRYREPIDLLLTRLKIYKRIMTQIYRGQSDGFPDPTSKKFIEGAAIVKEYVAGLDIDIVEGESYDETRERNKDHPFFTSQPEVCIATASFDQRGNLKLEGEKIPDYPKSVVAEYQRILLVEKVAGILTEGMQELDSKRGEITRFSHNLDVVRELQGMNLNVDAAAVDEILIRLFRGEIKRYKTARTEVLALPHLDVVEADNGYTATPAEPPKPGNHVPHAYNTKELAFLTGRGMTPGNAKALMDRGDYSKRSKLAYGIDEVFGATEHGASKARPLYKGRDPVIARIDPSERAEYLKTLYNVLLFGKNAHGVLPSASPTHGNLDHYVSAEGLREFLPKQPENLRIMGLELITDDSTRERLQNSLQSDLLQTGEAVLKHPDSHSLHALCVSAAGGEGKFRVYRSADRRALFEILSGPEGPESVRVFRYFSNHDDYTSFFSGHHKT